MGVQSIQVTGTFRYWRLFNVTGVNVTYVVISEMEAFQQGVGSTEYSAMNNPEVEIIFDDPDTLITNNLTQDLDFTINYLV